MDYKAVAMDPADLATDQCTTAGQMWCITGSDLSLLRYPDPSNNAVPLTEAVAFDGHPGSPLLPHVHNNCGGIKTCKVYATAPTGSQNKYRRVTVVVTWSDHGEPKTRVTSTQVTNTTRGLPDPLFHGKRTRRHPTSQFASGSR